MSARPAPIKRFFRSLLSRIGHIIVILLENCSFDHLYGLYPGAEGVQHSGLASIQVGAEGQELATYRPLLTTWLRLRASIRASVLAYRTRFGQIGMLTSKNTQAIRFIVFIRSKSRSIMAKWIDLSLCQTRVPCRWDISTAADFPCTTWQRNTRC